MTIGLHTKACNEKPKFKFANNHTDYAYLEKVAEKLTLREWGFHFGHLNEIWTWPQMVSGQVLNYIFTVAVTRHKNYSFIVKHYLMMSVCNCV